MFVPELVNEVAHVVGRPAVLEDTRQRMVAYSPQDGRIDPVRESTILHHRADRDVSEWLHRVGALGADRAIRVPGNRDLRMLPRLCVPVGVEGERLGNLWFIDMPDRMTADEVDLASHFAGRIARAWRRAKNRAREKNPRPGDETMRLVTGNAKARSRAATEVTSRGDTWTMSQVRVLTLMPVLAEQGTTPGPDDRELRRTAHAALRTLGTNGIHGADSTCAVLVLPDAGRGGGDRRHLAAARVFCELGTERLSALPGVERVLVGIGRTVSSVAEARASFRDARQSIELTTAFGLADEVADWADLGLYRLMSAAAGEGLRPDDLQPGIDRLRAQRDGEALLDTLGCYLTAGGRAQDAAAQMNLHRSSLYHRLSRVEKTLGIDLQDGARRATLHAALILLRLETG